MFKSGTTQLPSDPSTGMMGTWSLDAGTGHRFYESPDIPFVPVWSGGGSPFSGPPTVVLSLAGIEAAGVRLRVSVGTVNVQAKEFNIRVDVSGDCTLNTVLVTWFAYDAV